MFHNLEGNIQSVSNFPLPVNFFFNQNCFYNLMMSMFFHDYEIKGNQRTACKPLNYLGVFLLYRFYIYYTHF